MVDRLTKTGKAALQHIVADPVSATKKSLDLMHNAVALCKKEKFIAGHDLFASSEGGATQGWSAAFEKHIKAKDFDPMAAAHLGKKLTTPLNYAEDIKKRYGGDHPQLAMFADMLHKEFEAEIGLADKIDQFAQEAKTALQKTKRGFDAERSYWALHLAR